MRALCVEQRDLGAARVDVCLIAQLIPDLPESIRILDGLAVGGRLARRVEVLLTQLHRVDAQGRSDSSEDVLDEEHALRAAETTECRVGGLIRLGYPAVRVHVR